MNIDYSKYYWNNKLITLRQPKADDWQELIHQMFDSRTRFYFNYEIDMPTDIDRYKRKFIENLEPDKLKNTSFAIENKDGKHVGIANLFDIDEKHGKFGPIGILINQSDRGKGYASATLRLLGKYMFNERRMHKWNSWYIEGNEASAALHAKLGFKIEGIQRDVIFHDGQYWNEVMNGITEEEFFKNELSLPVI